jgi:tryptophan synthase beta chain
MKLIVDFMDNRINGFVEVPKNFYNVQSILDIPPPKGENIKLLPKIFPKEMLREEMSKDKYVPIPEEVREEMMRYRPTPLVEAIRLKKHLHLPEDVRILYKREDVSPTGSHKLNTALMQAYINSKEGIERLTTETGAGQWGSALSYACNKFEVDCTVYMVRASFGQKPYRKVLMKLFGADVVSSPSSRTEYGREIIKKDPQTSGSLGIAISEAIEDALGSDNVRYSLGSVLNSVLMHQTVIGQELKEQLKRIEVVPDALVGCIGGGSNFAGFMLPFIEEKISQNDVLDIVAVEPKACPSITRGKYEYDYGDSAEMTPMLKMYTLGHDFVPPPIHAGGLRYHGKAPIVSLLANRGIMRTVAYEQKSIFDAGVTFAKTEGIVPAPESSHAIKAAIDMAIEAMRRREKKTIVMNLSGHGLFDLKGYEDYMDGSFNRA